MKKLIVNVTGKQKNDKVDSIKMKALANSYEKNGLLYVIYKDSNLNEEQETTTMLKIAKDNITLVRSGGVKQQQIFMQNKESVSDYQTPYGLLKMMVKTHRLKIVLGTKSTIEIDYSLYINGSWQSDNELKISMKPAN